ncbi:DUF4198 domain-containing protein [Desulfobacca acetoxidans]
MKKCLLFVLWLTLLTVSSLYAHDTYVVEEGDALVVMHGHHGKSDPYKPEYIKGVMAYDASGKGIPVTIKPEETRVLLTPAQKPALVTFIYSAGPRVKTAEGWKSLSKREVKDYIESKKSVKYVKQINQWNDIFGKPLGVKMEIVPLTTLSSLKLGDKLLFQVLYNGKPLAGATVKAEGVEKDKLKTDSNGRAEVVIKKVGLNIVGVSQTTPTPNDPEADALGESATIAFEVK